MNDNLKRSPCAVAHIIAPRRLSRGDRSAPNGAERGASLATVIMVVAMMLALAFTVVAIAFTHLNLSFKSANNSRAKHLAEATIARAINELVANQNFGTTGTADERTVRVTLESLPEGSEGVLSFDPSSASSLGVPCSTNNRSETAMEGAAGKMIPGESFHLVAKAMVKNSTSVVEAVIIVPRFPYSVAAEGSIKSNGGLTVAAVRPDVVGYDLNFPIHEDDLEPGSLVTNSKSGDDAVVLSGQNKIYGDLQSSSGVTVEAETSILGEIRTQAEDEALPIININSYDPELEPGLQEVNSGAGTLEVTGYNKSYGDLTVDNGVRLNGGVLFVDGNLTISAGGVRGKGALVSTGNITVYGDGDASSDNQAAIIADGNVVLQGASGDKAKFAGLIYTNGQLKAENLRLAGVFVAAGSNSEVEFKNTEVYQDASKSRIEIKAEDTPFQIPTLTPPTMAFEDKVIPATYDLNGLEGRLEEFRNPNTGPGQPEYLFKVPLAGTSTGFVTHQYNAAGEVFYTETPGPDQYVVDGSVFGLRIYGQAVTSVAQAEDAAVTGMAAQLALEGRTLTPAQINSIKTSARTIFNSASAGFKLSQTSAQHTYDTSGSGSGGGEPESRFEWSLDLSDFFSQGRPLQVLFWSEYRDHG